MTEHIQQYSPQLISRPDGNSTVWELFINMVNTDDYISIDSVQYKVLSIQ